MGFRASLDAWRDGKASQDDVEAALMAELRADPEHASATRALIAAYRSAGFVPVPLAERLLSVGSLDPAAPAGHRTSHTLLRAPRSAVSHTMFRAAVERARASPATIPRMSHTGPVGPGTVLSAQYVLENIVPGGATGGMGVIYRARDLIQEEAQDRNPYVAIKILSAWIGQDPEALKSLNREYKKTLPLSHPNIVKVQNFGRDGSCVYLVMELLVGQSLAELISAGGTGLPASESLRITHALARALGYAHHMHIIHSDFKPSNAFITQDAAVKVMDFGMARAVSTPVGGDLPYASYEQIRGAAPDPRDDVYALGVVSYELLTGHHPFARKNAVEAHDNGLKPQAVLGLSRRQWTTLQSALSFVREKRPRDARAFETGLTPKKWPIKFLAVGAAALALVALATTLLTSNFLERRHAAAIAEELASNDPPAAADAVQRLLKEDVVTRATVLSAPGAAKAVLSVFEGRARTAFDPDRGLYDFPAALQALAPARTLLTDSASLAQFQHSLETEQQRQLVSSAAQFERLLAAHALLPESSPPGRGNGLPGAGNQPSEPSVQSVLLEIKQLDPAHPLLQDPRIPAAFRAAAAAAFDRADVARAAALVDAGLTLAPSDPGLLELRTRRADDQGL